MIYKYALKNIYSLFTSLIFGISHFLKYVIILLLLFFICFLMG